MAKAKETPAGERLGRWAERRKLSHEALAETLGVHQTTISAIIRGTRKPRVELALAIEKLTRIPTRAWA